MNKSASYLVATVVLWILQTSTPALQQLLPAISLPWRSSHVSPPLSQLLNQPVGLLNCLAAYCLLHARASSGRLSLRDNLLFLSTAFLITTGHGMHAVCVTVEALVGEVEGGVSDNVMLVVDWFHEYVSHNMFVGGVYLLLALVAKMEVDGVRLKASKKTDSGVRGNVPQKENGDASIARGGTEVVKTHGTKSSGTGSVLLHWVLPLVLGTYFSIFSTRTGTVAITLPYLAACVCAGLWVRRREGTGRTWQLFGSDLLVLGTLVKAAYVGLPVLALWQAGVL